MNMQAMMQQAQKLQRDMLKAKDEVEGKTFTSKQSLVEVVMKGNKEVLSVKIEAENLDKEDIEMLEDMIVLAVNENIKQIDKEMENKLGKFGGMAGMNYPDSLKVLIDSFKKLPSIGEKTAERLSFAVMNMSEEDINSFSKAIVDVKLKIKKCSICGNITENEICDICSDSSRDSDIICVVEDSKNIISLEKMGSYRGKYHVLNGLISPMDGKGPDDIMLDSLLQRIKKENIKEIIIAVSPTLEGETTSLYISKLLEPFKITVSKIAYGIPIGADMEYLDPMTLSMAMSNRNKIS